MAATRTIRAFLTHSAATALALHLKKSHLSYVTIRAVQPSQRAFRQHLVDSNDSRGQHHTCLEPEVYISHRHLLQIRVTGDLNIAVPQLIRAPLKCL